MLTVYPQGNVKMKLKRKEDYHCLSRNSNVSNCKRRSKGDADDSWAQLRFRDVTPILSGKACPEGRLTREKKGSVESRVYKILVSRGR